MNSEIIRVWKKICAPLLAIQKHSKLERPAWPVELKPEPMRQLLYRLSPLILWDMGLIPRSVNSREQRHVMSTKWQNRSQIACAMSRCFYSDVSPADWPSS